MARTKPSATGAAIRSFTAVIEPDEGDGGYVVTFPAIPDLATQGETLDEARRMAEDCLRGYLEVLRETGRPLPAPGPRRPADAPRSPGYGQQGSGLESVLGLAFCVRQAQA